MNSDVLTQEELDALLEMVKTSPGHRPAAAPSGPAPSSPAARSFDRPAESYDFRARSLLSEREVARLECALAIAARGLASAAGQLARTSASVGPPIASTIGTRLLLESLPRPCVCFLIEPGIGSGPRGALVVDPSLLATSVDLMLGGSGSVPPGPRDLTRAELALARRLAELLLAPIRAALRPLAPFTLKVVGVETDPRVVEGLPAGEPLLVQEFQLDAGALGGPVRLALPARTVAGALELAPPPPAPAAPAPARIAAAHPLSQLPVDAVVVLGEAELPLGAILDIEVGDVIRLERRKGEPVEVRIPGEKSLRGQPGVRAGRVAVRITSDKSESNGGQR